MDLGGSDCVDVGQEPVVTDVGLDSPSQSQLALAVDEVDELGLRVAEGAGSAREGKGLEALLVSLGGGTLVDYGER